VQITFSGIKSSNPSKDIFDVQEGSSPIAKLRNTLQCYFT